MDKNAEQLLISELLLTKFSFREIKGLITGELCIEKARPKERTAYIRHLKDHKSVLCECKDGKHEWCVDPDMLLVALDDASNEMDYSNWHTDKFDRAAEIVIRYCEEHKIPMKFDRTASD